jgi:hypothetical protein
MSMTKISYAGYRFPPEIIQQAIWLYLRFTLSLRDVEDLLAERAIGVSYESKRPACALGRGRSSFWAIGYAAAAVAAWAAASRRAFQAQGISSLTLVIGWSGRAAST